MSEPTTGELVAEVRRIVSAFDFEDTSLPTVAKVLTMAADRLEALEEALTRADALPAAECEREWRVVFRRVGGDWREWGAYMYTAAPAERVAGDLRAIGYEARVEVRTRYVTPWTPVETDTIGEAE